MSDAPNGKSVTSMTLTGWASVILGVVTSVGGVIYGGVQSKLGEHEAELQRINDGRLVDAYARGANDNKIATALSGVIELDARLQREMKSYDATLDAKLSAMDRRLQDEIAVGREDTRTKRAEIAASIGELRQLIDVNAAARIAHEERLRTLEKPARPGG